MKNMHKIAFLDTATLGNDISLSDFDSFGQVVKFSSTTADEVVQRISGVDIVITNKVVIDRSVMEQSPNLKLICVTATGTNNVDLEYAIEKGIQVKNVKGYSTESVAQHTFACLLNLIHHLNYYDAFVKSEAYSNQNLFTHIDKPFFELKGKVYGVIGLGDIGKRVAELATAFGCEVVYYSTSGNNDNPKYKRLGWEEFLAKSDFITIHAPLNDDTLSLVDKGAFEKMKSNVVIANMGRGGIVNEEALVYALSNNLIGGAALDVFYKEPMRSDSILKKVFNHPSVLFTPHIAWAGKEARISLMKSTLKNIEDFLAI